MGSGRRPAARLLLAALGLCAVLLTVSDVVVSAPRGSAAALRRQQLTPAMIAEIREVSRMERFGNLTVLERREESRSAEGTRRGTAIVLVRNEIYPDIKESIALYTLDLSSEGFETRVHTIDIGSQSDPSHDNVKHLKALIRSRWLGLLDETREGNLSTEAFDLGTGVVLIGDLPVPVVHRRKGEWTKEQPEGSGNMVSGCYEGADPMDIYLTDMDGDWSYTDEEGVVFFSTVDPDTIPVDSETVAGDGNSPRWTPGPKLGNAGARPEIWLGRIDAGPVSIVGGQRSREREVQLLNDYFARIRAYRHRYFPYVTEGVGRQEAAARDRLVYFDDDWAAVAQPIATSHAVWPGPVVHNDEPAPGPQPVNRYVDDGGLTAREDYVQRLTEPRHLWLESLMHSNWDGHEFRVGNQSEWLSNAALNNQPFRALFYYLQGCHTCDPRHNNNLGAIYLFPGEALAVLGNTIVGPHDNGIFYGCLEAGMNLGQSQMMNQRGHARTDDWAHNWPWTPGKIDPKRYYQQTILGDPTLRPVAFVPRPQPSREILIYEPNYGQVLAQVPFGITRNVGALEATVFTRHTAEQPGKFKPIHEMPERGIDITPVDPEKPVIDPLWQVSDSPQLRLRFEAFQQSITLQTLPQLQFRPRLVAPR
jgi:hypothetical protein